MPNFWQIGIRIGTRMVMAAVGSRKQPTNNISRLASSRNMYGSWVKPSTHSPMADRDQDRYQDGDGGGGFQETADEQHQQVGQQQEHVRVLGKTQHPFTDGRSGSGSVPGW